MSRKAYNMLNTANDIKARIDLRDFIEGDLGKPKGRSSRYNMYPCPLHHERKGTSLTVWADGWKCWGACNTGGDLFAWLKAYRDLDFGEALRYLGGNTMPAPRARQTYPLNPPELSEPPSAEWQSYARHLVELSEEILWSTEGVKALIYLKQRGFPEGVIRRAHLGYNPAIVAQHYQYGRVLLPNWQVDGKQVRVACGITIPHFAEGHLWQVRIRRPPGVKGAKYMGIRGGSKALYGVDDVCAGVPVMIVEGEFDQMVLDYCCRYGDLRPVALASASNKNINPRWFPHLIGATRILARMDNDAAGKGALEGLGRITPIRRVDVPLGKDVNDFYLARGAEKVREWVLEVVK